MDSIVSFGLKLLSNPERQPLLQGLKTQNEEFSRARSEVTKLLMENGDSDEEDCLQDDKGGTDKEVAMSILKKLAKLFEYTSLTDKCILLIGTISTIIHAASFPVLAILFGKVSNAYIAHRLHENQNSTDYHEANTSSKGEIEKLILLTNVVSNIQSAINTSFTSTTNVSVGSYIQNISFHWNNGTEKFVVDFPSYVENFSLYYVYIGIVIFLTSFLQTVSWEWVAENQLYRVKQKFIYQLLRQEQAWFSKNSSGSLVAMIADDCERFREGVGQKFSLVIEYITISIFGALIGLITNFKLTLVFLAAAPFILTKLFLLWRNIAEKSAVKQKKYAKAGKFCSEVLSGIKTVSAFCGEEKEIARYNSALGKGADAAMKKEMLLGIGIGGMYLLIYAFYAVALWYAVYLVSQGSITPGEIYTVFFSITISAFSLGSLLPFVNSIATSFSSVKLLEKVLESIPNIDPYNTAGERPRKFNGNVRFTNVTFAYSGREGIPIFKDLKLEIRGGQTVAIVGPCSSGKSTLINLLLRFYDPQSGQVKMDTYDIKTLNVRWIREQIGVVEQNAV